MRFAVLLLTLQVHSSKQVSVRVCARVCLLSCSLSLYRPVYPGSVLLSAPMSWTYDGPMCL